MKKEFTANTVEEAKKLAAAEFGVDISKLTVTVVEEEKKGFLGIGRSDAKIVAEYEPSKAEIAADYIKEILKCMNIDAELDITEMRTAQLLISRATPQALLSAEEARLWTLSSTLLP